MGVSVDELQQRIAECKAMQREMDWLLVDVVGGGVAELVASGTTISAAADLVASATAGHRASWVKLYHRLYVTFGEDCRLPTLDLHVYRVALGWEDPVQAMEMAADNQWSAKELKAWIDEARGKERKTRTRVRVEGTMDWRRGDIVITPESYGEMELPEGLLGVPVEAVITSI